MSVVKDVEIQHQGVVFKFQIKLIAEGQTPPPPPPEQTLDVLKIVKVTTSADDGNKGDNMLVDDANRWSCKGKACTATFDLGGIQQVGEMYVRFFKGAERTESFELSLSEDGQNWLGKLTGEQQDQAGVVLVINPFFNARYVRFVGQGNNANDWNSVEFVEVKGKKLTEPGEPQNPEPEPEPEPPTPEPEPPTPDGEIIEDGVKMFYPKIGQAVQFKFGSNNAGRAQWRAQLPKCFVNQETTLYIKIDKITKASEEISVKIRGGTHSSGKEDQGCCYILGIEYNLDVNSQFECPHPKNHPMKGYNVITPKGGISGNSIEGKLIGLKTICYLEGDHDHMEVWVDPDGYVNDKPANNWKQFFNVNSKEFVGKCNGKGNEFTYIRCDDVEGAGKNGPGKSQLFYASCREISVITTGTGSSSNSNSTLKTSKKTSSSSK